MKIKRLFTKKNVIIGTIGMIVSGGIVAFVVNHRKKKKMAKLDLA